ncbi:MAG TPA: hypothetical protein ENG92_00315, partial [Thiolapillus brandeum]|nr:hypothetical protein [Thiolapillus brandeum]
MSEKSQRLPLSRNATGQALVLATIALLALGCVMVYSAVASVKAPGKWYARVDARHVIFAAMAAGILLFAWRINYRILFGKGSWPVLATVILVVALALGLLVSVHPFAAPKNHAFRWILLVPGQSWTSFQPSELIKLAMVIFLSAWLTRDGVDIRKLKWTFPIAASVVGMCVAVVINEDFGTGLI